nr:MULTISPECIES: hypothetical protein [unclassified Rhodococcus (in: high G+C Gram-positive bacteria)]
MGNVDPTLSAGALLVMPIPLVMVGKAAVADEGSLLQSHYRTWRRRK